MAHYNFDTLFASTNTADTLYPALSVPPFTSPATTATSASHESPSDKLAVIAAMLKWTYDNQLKLLERMDHILSKVSQIEDKTEILRSDIGKLSEDLNDWKRWSKTGANTAGERWQL